MSRRPRVLTPDQVRAMPDVQRRAVLSRLMGEAVRRARAVDRSPLELRLEDYQKAPPGNWRIRMFMGGRGAGKTWTGASWAAHMAENVHRGGEGVLIGAKFKGVREVMVEGPGGIIEQLGGYAKDGGRVLKYNRSTYEITTTSGSKIYMRSAEAFEDIRGLNLRWAWCDEIGSWQYAKAWYEGLVPALRIGRNPQVMVTTTPRRVKLVKDLWKRIQKGDPRIVHTFATTFDNPHLNESVKDDLREQYEGSHLGLQELYGQMIEDVDGALWSSDDMRRITDQEIIASGGFVQLVVCADPSSADDAAKIEDDESFVEEGRKGRDDFGVIVVGKLADGRYAVISDDTVNARPAVGVQAVADAYGRRYLPVGYQPTVVIFEGSGNVWGYAKDLFQRLAPHVPLHPVFPRASKADRARSVATMYQRDSNRVYHLGELAELEDEMTTWIPGESKWSPNRIDALVHGLQFLEPTSGGDPFEYSHDVPDGR